MHRGSTHFLRAVVVLIGLVVLALCMFALPAAISSGKTGAYFPLLIGMYLPAIPFFLAAQQIWKLLSYIDKNQAFSQASIKALSTIKYCALIVGSLYALGLPYMFFVAEQDDAPGVGLIGLVFTFAPLAAAIFAGVLQKLLQNAMALKSENDLTV